MTAPEQLLRRLEWRVVRRLDGRLQGSYRTALRGSGLDFADLRTYTASDDVRHIDWNVTARMDEPYVREYLQDRELTAWLVLDQSASMRFGSRRRAPTDARRRDARAVADPGPGGKDTVLSELAVSLARIFSHGGNRTGAILYDHRTPRVVPPGSGRTHVLRLAHLITAPSTGEQDGHPTDLAAMIHLAARTVRRRSLVIVISDFIGEGDWGAALSRLAQRHEVTAVRVVDPAEFELPDLGLVLVEDAETGEQLFADTSDPLLRQRFREQAAAREAGVHASMARAGVIPTTVDTSTDLVSALVDLVRRSGRRA